MLLLPPFIAGVAAAAAASWLRLFLAVLCSLRCCLASHSGFTSIKMIIIIIINYHDSHKPIIICTTNSHSVESSKIALFHYARVVRIKVFV